MAKIESGTMTLDLGELPFAELQEYVERTFMPVAQNKGLDFGVDLATSLPPAIYCDAKRLQQVLRNLLSNAFKFTEQGKVGLRVGVAAGGWSSNHEALNRAASVIAFAVTDTGIGISADKLKIIFEPFQQAESGTSRKYGGTGLGLSISREMVRLLGGDVEFYIPRRLEEGYGLNAEALKQICESGAKLIVSVDCGVTAVVEAEA